MRSAALLVLLTAPWCAASDAQQLAKSVTIYRDTYGVPHIRAKTDAGAVFGLMYAQAEDNFWQLETDLIRTAGRLAEVEGAAGLANDILSRAWETEKRARESYAKATPPMRALCDAFAAGINYYLETHPQAKPRLITKFEPWFLLAEEHRGAAGTGITAAERRRAFPALAGAVEPPQQQDPDEGSNMWALSPSRSATGRAMLMINPHIGFFGGGQRYEAHLQSGEGLDVSGFAILGTAYIRSGHNRYLGWSHTNNNAQTADVYLESFDVLNDPLSYRYGREHRKAVEWTDKVRVKTDTGVEERTVVFRKTHHGPVLGLRDGQALAVRAASIAGGTLAQRWAMGKARNLQEFKAALAKLALTGSNTIYADVHGNIFYVHGNAIPRRSTRYDWSKPVDGSDPETEWAGLHPLDELPQVLNPKSGYVQNCNSTAFLTTDGADNPDRSRYPAYMVPEPDTPRAQRSRAILSGTNKFTFAQWTVLALDSKIGIAEEGVKQILDAWRAKEDPALGDLIDVLKRWDGVSRNDSVATTLFVHSETIRRGGVADPLAALARVKSNLEAAWGTWRVGWGEINRLQRVHTSGTQEPFGDDKPSVPVPGAPSFTGTVFTFGARQISGQKRWYGTVGNTYVAVVEFGKKPVTRSILVNGQSADPSSKHYFDQAHLYSTQKFKPAWFDFSEIKKNLERSYKP
jgi:acyl-homoserine-lactone acylase